MWGILLAVAAFGFIYWLLIRPHKYWIKKGIKQTNPVFILGDNWGPFLKKHSFAEMVVNVYQAHPDARYSGFYQFLVPTLALRDPDLIKQITVKDFDHFLDHRVFIPEDADPLWGKNLFALTGRKWRDMRTTLSPAFTSSKMKFMFGLIAKNGEQFAKYFLNEKKNLIDIELKDAFTRFTNDVIATTAFGVECDSLTERGNEFYRMGKETTDLRGFWNNIKITGYFLVPGLFKLLRVRFFSKAVSNFFISLIKSNIKSREKHGIVRPDMIHLLLEARKHGFKNDDSQPSQDTGFATVEESDIGKNQEFKKIEISDVDIAAQALIFFFAGFDAVSSLMCFASYELAVNQDIQDKLIQEIDKTNEMCKGTLTYEALLGMKYMDQVISEALRKWPNAIGTDRICTKPYTIQPQLPDEKPVYLEKDAIVWIPVFGIHRDPQHWPDPERFDPERFNEENRENIKPYTYMPFGVGPRNCIGSRFALLETKVLFFYLLSHFQIVPTGKSKIPLVLCKTKFNLDAEGGFCFGLKRRVNV